MKWFSNPQTLEELKQQYKKLALKHHPDLGGNTADMQGINNEYDILFAKLKKHTRNSRWQDIQGKQGNNRNAGRIQKYNKCSYKS